VLCTMVIISRDAVLGSSLIFFRDIVSLKPTIVLIIGHFLTSVKFCKILRQYRNSAEKGKLHGSARNSAVSGKLWALVIVNAIEIRVGKFLPAQAIVL